MKRFTGKALFCTKAPIISGSSGRRCVEGGSKPDKSTLSTDTKKTSNKQNADILLGVGEVLADRPARGKCPEHVTNGPGTTSQSGSVSRSSDGEKRANVKKVHSELSPNSENARNRRLQLALLYTERMPHVKGTDGSRMVPWSDVKEILLPSCSDPECDIVLNALKIVFRYPWSSEVMHPCSPKEQMIFLRSFRLVPPGTLLVDVREVQNKLEHIWEMVRQKHTTSEDENSLRCHYTKAQCPQKKLLSRRKDMAVNDEADHSFRWKNSDNVSNSKTSPADKYVVHDQNYQTHGGASAFKERKARIPDIGTLKIKRIIRHQLLPTEETTPMKPEGKFNPFLSSEDEDVLKIECRNKPLIPSEDNEKRENALLEMEAVVPVLKPFREEKTSIHDCFMVVSLAVKIFPKLKYYLLEKCREFIVGRPSSPEIKMRCCDATEARIFTSWVLRHQGWEKPWQHVTSRDILIDCNSVVEQLKEQPNFETKADSDTDVLVEIQTPQIKDIPELDTLEGDCSNSCDRLFGTEANNSMCYGHTKIPSEGNNTYLLSPMKSSHPLPKQVKKVLFKSEHSKTKSDATVLSTSKYNNVTESGQSIHPKATQMANSSNQKLETIFEDESEDCQINHCTLQAALTNQTSTKDTSMSIKDRFTQTFLKKGKPISSHQLNAEKSLEMLCRGTNIQNDKVYTAPCGKIKHVSERRGKELETKPSDMQCQDSRSTPSLANLILRETELRETDTCDVEKVSTKGPKISTKMLYELHGDKKRSLISYNADKKTVEYTLVDSNDLRSFYLDDKVPEVNKSSNNLHFSPSPPNRTQGHPKKKIRIKSPEVASDSVNVNQNATGTADKEEDNTETRLSKDNISLAKTNTETLVGYEHLSPGDRSLDIRMRSFGHKPLTKIRDNRSHMLARTMSEPFKLKHITNEPQETTQHSYYNSDADTRSRVFLEDKEHTQPQDAKSNEHNGYSTIQVYNSRQKDSTKRLLSVVDIKRRNATDKINRNVSYGIQMGHNKRPQHKDSMDSKDVDKYNFKCFAQPSNEIIKELTPTVTRRKKLIIPKMTYTSSPLDQKKKDKWYRNESLPSLQTKVNRNNEIGTISKSSFDDTIESLQSLRNFHNEVRNKHLGGNACSLRTEKSGENNKVHVSDKMSPQKVNNRAAKQQELKVRKKSTQSPQGKPSSPREEGNSEAPVGCSIVNEIHLSKNVGQLSNQSEIKHIIVKIPCETMTEDTDNDSKNKIKSGAKHGQKKKLSTEGKCKKKHIGRKIKGHVAKNIQSTESLNTQTPPSVSQSESCLQCKKVLTEHNSSARRSMSAPVLGQSSYKVSVNNLKLTFHRVDEETENALKQDISKEDVLKTEGKTKNAKPQSHNEKPVLLSNATSPKMKEPSSITNCKLGEDPECVQNVMVALQRTPEKASAMRLPNVSTRCFKNKLLKSDSAVEKKDTPQNVDDSRGCFQGYRNGTLVAYDFNKFTSEDKHTGTFNKTDMNTDVTTYRMLQKDNECELTTKIDADVSSKSVLGNGQHEGIKGLQNEDTPKISTSENRVVDGEEITITGVHHKKKWLKDFYEEKNVRIKEEYDGNYLESFDMGFQSNGSDTTGGQSHEMKTEVQIKTNSDSLAVWNSLPTLDYFTSKRGEKDESDWHECGNPNESSYFVQYDPTIDIAEEVVVSEPQVTELVDTKQEKYDASVLGVLSNENIQDKTTLQQSESQDTIIFNDPVDVAKDDGPPIIDFEGSIYVVSPKKCSHHGSNVLRRSARTSLSPRKSYDVDLSNEEDDGRCQTSKTKNKRKLKTKKSVSKKSSKRTKKKIHHKNESVDGCLTNGKDDKGTKRRMQGFVREQQRMMDILSRKSKEQGSSSATKDEGKLKSERTDVINETTKNNTAAMKKDLVDQCDPVCDSEGMSQGGLTKLDGVICPYVVMNGYKFVALVDVIKIFPSCVKKCAIPRMILMKHKGIYKTFCTWEQVYTMDLVFHQKGRFLTTGDVLLKLESVMEHLSDIKSLIKEQHKDSKLKSSQNCRYHF